MDDAREAREALIAELVRESGLSDSHVRRLLNALSLRMNEEFKTSDAFDMPGVGPLSRAVTGLMGIHGRLGRLGRAMPQRDLIVNSNMRASPDRGSMGGVLGVVEPGKKLVLGDLFKDLKKE
jgi:hypothetical protein